MDTITRGLASCDTDEIYINPRHIVSNTCFAVEPREAISTVTVISQIPVDARGAIFTRVLLTTLRSNIAPLTGVGYRAPASKQEHII